MAKQNDNKLNQLERDLPEGLLVDASWLKKRGYSTSLRSQYLAAGWLQQPVRSVYRRPRGSLSWQQVVISLQTLLGYSLTVGGRTALELEGYGHYLAHATNEVHLYGPKPPPGWLKNLKVGARFLYHNDRKLFRTTRSRFPLLGLNADPAKTESAGTAAAGTVTTTQPWGQWNWPLVLSTPERAIIELLDELPSRETFHQADQLFGGMANLSPRRLQELLVDCRNVKVKRLFFYFADRHRHTWLKRLDKDEIAFGTGKRMLVRGGKLDPTYQITVPEDLDGVR
jgi:hypothetical protein